MGPVGALDLHTVIVIAGVIAGQLVANVGLIFGAYVSVRVAIAKLEVKVDTFHKNVNDLGDKIREIENKQQEIGYVSLSDCTLSQQVPWRSRIRNG